MKTTTAASWLARLVRPGCPPGWKLTRSISEAADPRTEWHVMRCARCSEECRALRALAEEARAAAPSPEKMSREARDEIGARLRTLAAAPEPPRWWPQWLYDDGWRRRALIGLALAIPTITTVAVLTGRRASDVAAARSALQAPAEAAGESRATIRAIGPARFSRAHFQPDEIVRLDDGEIELDIAPLGARERFRVVTDDGEVEVRGTRFKVAVTDHRLAGVHVWHGQVEVRSRGGALAVLEAGDDWVREAVPAKLAPEAAAPPPPAAARTESRARAARRTAPAAKHHARVIAAVMPGSKSLPAARDARPLSGSPSFGHAWSRLRDGDAQAAAAEFAEVERVSQGRDIEEDALYWRAVAVERAGDAAGARTLFAAFLDRFPSSSRAGEAAAALGRLLLEAGDAPAARGAFERALHDPSPEVRASAQEGLRHTQDRVRDDVRDDAR